MKPKSSLYSKSILHAVLPLLLTAGMLGASVEEAARKVPEADQAKITEAVPHEKPAKPAKDRLILVFSMTKGFRHSSIEHGVFAMDAMGKKSGAFTIEHAEDPSVFTADNLERFDAIMMLNTTGELFDEPARRAALLNFVKGGKGLIGIHSASDTFYTWPEYGEMMGGYFDGHPWHEKVLIKVEDPEHATCACFKGDTFEKVDEIYQYKPEPYSRERLRVLLSLDPSGTNMKKNGMKRQDGDYAVGWVQSYGKGRVFYCNLGHREDTYWHPTVLAHYLAGIQFALGDLEADTTPSAQLKAASSGPVLQKGDRLAIVGDSITEQKLYSKFIETYILACMPQLNVQCMQFGWGGERAPGFANRMDNDLVPWKPDVITTCYGMNDGEYRAYEDRIGKAYADGMRRIIDRMNETGAKIVVGSPGVVDSQTWASREPDRDQVYNPNLDHLRSIARDLARENGSPFADVFGPMMRAMVAAKQDLGNDYHVAGGDGVHPSSNGHLIMAYAFLKALGLDGDLGTITIDARSGKAQADGGHKVVDSGAGQVKLESSRYPFCFYGNEKDPNGTRSILPYVPFNRDLNRLTLKVKNMDANKAQITWGATSKTFTREELSQGINLAAEFIENPFVEPFTRVLDAVRDKQNFETPMIKELITRFRSYKNVFEDDQEVTDALNFLRGKLIAKDDELYRAAKAAVKPVTHEISVRPLE